MMSALPQSSVQVIAESTPSTALKP